MAGRVHSRLQVVAGSAMQALHRACRWLVADERAAAAVSQRLRLLLHIGLLPSQLLERLLHRLAPGRSRRLPRVNLVEFAQIAAYSLAKGFSLGRQVALADNRLARGHRAQLGTVNCHCLARDQSFCSRELDERRRALDQGRGLRAAKAGNRFVVGREPAQHPHHLDVAQAFALQPPRRPYAVEIAIHIQLEQVAGIVGRPARRCRLRPIESQCLQVERSDPGINDPHDRLFVDQFIEHHREQRRLLPRCTASMCH